MLSTLDFREFSWPLEQNKRSLTPWESGTDLLTYEGHDQSRHEQSVPAMTAALCDTSFCTES